MLLFKPLKTKKIETPLYGMTLKLYADQSNKNILQLQVPEDKNSNY
jgi:hypothetical protein